MAIYKIPCFNHEQFKTADVWAEENIVLKESGRFSFNITPYFREPTKSASDLNRVCRVVVMCPAQAGKTQMLVNVICHAAVYNPNNTLVILDSNKTALRLSKNRIRPALREFAHLKVFQSNSSVDRSKSVENIMLDVGANLIFGGSRSASDLCSTPVQLLCLDELDRFVNDLSTEGDPILLALKRQLRFNNSMALITSTPTIAEGAINKHYQLGTQEVWSVRCHCGNVLSVKFDDISFENDIPTYTCMRCGEVFSEHDIERLEHLYDSPKNPNPFTDKSGRVCRSFCFTSTLMHGIYTWDQIEKERKQAESIGEPAIRSFKNTTLGEIYIPPSIEISNYEQLLSYAKDFDRNSIPEFVDYICAGVDTQDQLFEVVIVGFSSDLNRWCFIEHRQIIGDLAEEVAVWESLKSYIGTFECINIKGERKHVNLVAHDCGGHFYYEVLSLSLLIPGWRAVKGRSYSMQLQEMSIIDKVSRKPVKELGNGTGRVDLTFVNTRYCKDLIYYKLSEVLKGRDENLFYPSSLDSLIDQNFFEQLTSEVKEYDSKGVCHYKLKGSKRNECLDCVVYALAAGEILRLAGVEIKSVRGASNEDSVKGQPKKKEEIKPKEIKKENVITSKKEVAKRKRNVLKPL